MLIYTRIYIVSLVLSIQAIAIFTGKLPYFPIEISRTAEASPYNRILFPIGVICLPLFMYAMNEWSNAYLLALAGLIILAVIDDKTSLMGHQIGVAIMAIGSFYAIFSLDNLRTRLSLLLCAALLFCGRVAMKVIAVVLFEGLYSFSQVKDKCIEIGYNGMTRHPQFLIPVFQVCGVMQWLVFYLILTAI